MQSDRQYMVRALELAKNGQGFVSPNPMVGCVIVHNNRIIGEGWHKRYGGPHAEVNAINSVKQKNLLNESTVYVTLEPCSHYGNTPPCADLLVQHHVKKVVVCNDDPNPQVSGRGIARLREAGIEVSTGLLREEGLYLNRRFFHYMIHKKPWIVLKWAQTADGFIARKNFDSKWISSEQSRLHVHKWRSEEDTILVGKNTAMHDNPSLNVRGWDDNHPTRIVIDRNLALPTDINIYDKRIPTIIFNCLKAEKEENLEYILINNDGVPEQVPEELYRRKIQSVFVEGGSQTLQRFIDSGWWNEARVFHSPVTFGNGISAPEVNISSGREEQITGPDTLIIYTKQ